MQVGISECVVVGRINGVAALMGFSHKKMYGRFAGKKKSSRNSEVPIRRVSIDKNRTHFFL